jgi:hypothetical protein
VALLWGLSWLLVAAGCSDAKGRNATKRLLEEIDLANRLYARAVSLMTSTPVKVDGQFTPLSRLGRVGGGSSVELPPPLAVHPQAWDALVKAEKGLTRAIIQYGPDSGPEVQALANVMLGNVLMLKAEYQLAAGAADRQDARDTVVLAGRSVSMVQLYMALITYSRQLMALGDKDVAEMLSAAREEAAKAQAAADKTQEEIQSLRTQRDQHHAANEKLIPQARRMRLDSQQAGGTKGMDLLDQALKMESEINENVSAIAALENTIELRQAALGDLTLAVQAAQGRQKAAEAILAARKNYTDSGSGAIEAFGTDEAKARNEVQEQVSHLARICERVSGAEDAAAQAYGPAISKFQTARRLQPRGQDVQTIARLADAHWALAELKDQSLHLRRRNMLLVARLAAIWTTDRDAAPLPPAGSSGGGDALIEPADDVLQAVPAFARGILAYVPNPQQARKDAIENYQQAGELYGTATRLAPFNLRWTYQGQAAAAYIALYRLSGDAEVLAKAKEALKEALADKRESSYLVDVVELEKLLQSSTTQPASRPAAGPSPP